MMTRKQYHLKQYFNKISYFFFVKYQSTVRSLMAAVYCHQLMDVTCLFNRPSVAGDILQPSLLLIVYYLMTIVEC